MEGFISIPFEEFEDYMMCKLKLEEITDCLIKCRDYKQNYTATEEVLFCLCGINKKD